MKFKYTGIAIIGLFLVLFWGSRLNLHNVNSNDSIQLPASTVMTVEEMNEDIDFLIAKIMNVHPQTHSGMPQYLAKVAESVKNKINESRTAGEFYFLAATVSSSLNDAHTALHYRESEGSRVLNLPLVWLKRSLCVKQDTDTFLAGDEIISVGGKAVVDILKEISDFIPAENEGWIRARAGKSLVNEAVLKHLNLVNLDSTVTVTYLRDKAEKEVNLPLQPVLLKNDNNDYISYTFYDEMSLGVLRLDKCIYDTHFKSQVKEFFKEVNNNKIRHVALDVRQNTGGSSQVMDEILSYLQKVEKVKNYGAVIRYSKDASSQRQGMWRTSGVKEYHTKEKAIKHVADKSLLFDGNLYILTSNLTFSSGNWVAVMAYDNEIATLIGEPTGNAPSCFGDVLSFKLPNSGYHLSLSYKKFKRPEPSNDPANTLTPDIIVYSVAEDLRSNKDAQIEELLKLIASQ